MPVRRSSSDSGGTKVARKVKVAIGKAKGLGDGVRTLGLKNSDFGKAHVKRTCTLTNGGSKRSSDDGRTLESGKKVGKRVRSRGNDNDAVSYVDRNEKLSGKAKSSDVGKAYIKGILTKGGSKRLGDDGRTLEPAQKGGKKVRSRGYDNHVVSYDGNQKLSGKGHILKGELKTKNRKEIFGDGKLQQIQKNAFGNGALKKNEKKKDSSVMRKDQHPVDSVEKAPKKKGQGKKSLATDSDMTENVPKKKKRVIRIDPHDTSNKRLDDSISNNGNSQAKKDLEETASVEISKNAQFRAICPSTSILSFVEDNLLGRRRDIEFRRAGYNTELSSPLDNIPFSTSSERERIEVPVFRNKLEFFAAAKVSSSLPPLDYPEIAFAGRSNVGKSSLLNSLTRQWGVVRTSDKPGLTQTINFFKLGPKLSLVDLPGYGFAFAKDEVKEAWEELVREYVSTRASLKRVCLLVDTKWGMKPRDLELIDLMERYQTQYQIVLTKTDLVFPIDVARRAMQIEENLKANKSAVQPLMMVSSKTGAGIRSLRTVLANVARLVSRTRVI